MKAVRHQAWHIQINFKSQTVIANGIKSNRGNESPLKLRLSSFGYISKLTNLLRTIFQLH